MESEVIDELRAVKDALDTWADWMNCEDYKLGFGRSGVGFNSKSVNGWDDFERQVDKNMAINVMALYEGLNERQQMAVNHFHLSAVWRPARFSLDECYEQAVAVIEKGLKRRGLI